MTGQVKASVSSVVTDLKMTRKDWFSKTRTQLPVSYHVVSHVPFAGGSPQKKGVILELQMSIKSVKVVSCVDQLSSVLNVTNVPLVVTNLPVGSRLHKFWERWAALGVSPSPQGGLYPTLPVQTLPDQKTHNNKLLCRSSQEQLPVGGIASAIRQTCCRIGPKSTVPGVLQPVISCTKTQQPVASYLGSEQTKQLSENAVFQDGDSGNNTDIPPSWGVGDLHRLQRCILPHPYKQPVQEVHAVSHPKQNLPIQSTTLWPVHNPHGIHCDSQRGQMVSNEGGYKDPPVPRRLVGQSYIPPGLSSTHPDTSSPLQRIRVADQRGKIRTGAQANFQFRRLPV